MTNMSNRLSWRKSTYSADREGCVEVADLSNTRFVRDSKNPGGHMLTVTTPAWAAFVTSAKTGRFA